MLFWLRTFLTTLFVVSRVSSSFAFPTLSQPVIFQSTTNKFFVKSHRTQCSGVFIETPNSSDKYNSHKKHHTFLGAAHCLYQQAKEPLNFWFCADPELTRWGLNDNVNCSAEFKLKKPKITVVASRDFFIIDIPGSLPSGFPSYPLASTWPLPHSKMNIVGFSPVVENGSVRWDCEYQIPQFSFKTNSQHLSLFHVLSCPDLKTVSGKPVGLSGAALLNSRGELVGTVMQTAIPSRNPFTNSNTYLVAAEPFTFQEITVNPDASLSFVCPTSRQIPSQSLPVGSPAIIIQYDVLGFIEEIIKKPPTGDSKLIKSVEFARLFSPQSRY